MDTSPRASITDIYKHWGFWVGILVVIGIIFIAVGGSKQTPADTAPREVSAIGQEGYLRLPNNSDAAQMICLAPTQEVYQKYTTSLMAHDTQGILDLGNEGLFCVGNGSKVLVIDTAFGLRNVRVVAGMSAADTDKEGKAGWVAKEWVVDR